MADIRADNKVMAILREYVGEDKHRPKKKKVKKDEQR